MSKKFHVLYAKHYDDSTKEHHFLRLHDDSRKLFVNTSEGNWVFIFLIMLPKHGSMGSKF